jgi:predicted lipoprotein with Yx(FWY)xxD motif
MPRPRVLQVLSMLAAAALGGCALFGADVPIGSSGGVLVDEKGMTLYTFDRDRSGRSECYGRCAEAWPPLRASDDARPRDEFSIVTRDDGTRQWAYKNKPLYRRAGDAGPGDRAGDGADNLWRVAKS